MLALIGFGTLLIFLGIGIESFIVAGLGVFLVIAGVAIGRGKHHYRKQKEQK